jgi:hypothetical protein
MLDLLPALDRVLHSVLDRVACRILKDSTGSGCDIEDEVPQLCAREKCSVWQVNMTISLSFLAPSMLQWKVSMDDATLLGRHSRTGSGAG